MASAAVLDERALFEVLAGCLAAAVERMAGTRPVCSWDPLPAAPAPEDVLRWRQPLPPLAGAVWIVASSGDWGSAVRLVLASVGISDPDENERRSTYSELIGQVFREFAQALAARWNTEVLPGEGAAAGEVSPDTRWAEVNLSLGETSFAVVAGVEEALLRSMAQGSAGNASPQPRLETARAPAPSAVAAPPERTFDLLLDVELPVSVSFGRAQIPLKEVLTLATGSIVELNRTVNEPVEVILNNCVIARGDVVVVEGNFGVRIREVVSRQERLRTFQ